MVSRADLAKRNDKWRCYNQNLREVTVTVATLHTFPCYKCVKGEIGAFNHKPKSLQTQVQGTQITIMAQGSETIFSNEELSAFVGQIIVRAPHYIEIACGCTNKKVGDSVGILRIIDDGTIRASCHCNQNCGQVFTCPAKFVKHALSGTNVPNWKKKVWVLDCNGEKVKLCKTGLLRYYKGDEYVRPRNQVSHRDEFLSCCACNKVRRFELRTRDACRFYHFAAARENRTCNDMIPGRWTCEDNEERSLRRHSGCRKNPRCKGCEHCVCFGCKMCRFEDCGCKVCAEFYANAPN